MDYIPDSSEESDVDEERISNSRKARIQFVNIDEPRSSSYVDRLREIYTFEPDIDIDSEISLQESEHKETNKDKGSQMQGVYALPSQKTADGKRKWDKKQSCVFSSKLYPKLPRHLEKVHSKEVEVQRALAFEKGSKERKEAWKSMRNKGNFAHNMMVYNKGKGQVIPCKRPLTSIEETNYIQCKECKGTYRRSELWRYV
ncbi:hypothetical protein DPMN_157401 [Dreissena polymorpha]|uniref:Uncharacterized protein n=1 Tax=Dreissena polymorpha TaxID=45954 RepID=A0A9D4IPZ2_DREPO|nr:hypothetical protein DPMN_157401 [Dreissena polymorpha]